MTNATRFAWECIGSPRWEPPEVKRGERYGTCAECWLCGGPTEGKGWPWRTAISPTFTNHTLAAAPWSDTVCQPCAYMSSGDAWREYVATRPDQGWKSVHPLSWRTYSHVFAASGLHYSPKRDEWKGVLLDPPAPPFLMLVAESGQKHIVFRGQVAYDPAIYPLQLEETRVFVQRDQLARCIEQFEELLHMGFTRDEVATGRYSQGRVGKAALNDWWAAEERMAMWRHSQPEYVRLAHMVAHGPKREDKPA